MGLPERGEFFKVDAREPGFEVGGGLVGGLDLDEEAAAADDPEDTGLTGIREMLEAGEAGNGDGFVVALGSVAGGIPHRLCGILELLVVCGIDDVDGRGGSVLRAAFYVDVADGGEGETGAGGGGAFGFICEPSRRGGG